VIIPGMPDLALQSLFTADWLFATARPMSSVELSRIYLCLAESCFAIAILSINPTTTMRNTVSNMSGCRGSQDESVAEGNPRGFMTIGMPLSLSDSLWECQEIECIDSCECIV